MPFCQFFRKGLDGHALLVWPSKTHHTNWKILFVLGANEYLERLEVAYSFMLKHSKIKQCDCFLYVWTLPHISIKTCLPKMKILRLALRSKTKHARLRSSLSGLCTSRGIPHGTTLALLICVHNDWLLDSLASLHITRMSVV